MASRGSFAHDVDDWEKLITNVLKNQAELPDVTAHRVALEEMLVDVKARGAQLQSRRSESLELRAQLRKGGTQAAKLRSLLRSHYGFQNPKLLDYGIKPIGGKRKRSQNPEQPTPEEPKPEAPAPAPQAKPASQTS